ncbi:MAG: multidrug transporter [Burkholderiales bacterium 68-12]|nr:MAG: multidrug transporter [Burkholderiales bacterium 68-12]
MRDSFSLRAPCTVRRTALALALLTLAGCSFIPAYERPAAPVPPQWPAQAAAAPEAGQPPGAALPWQDFVQDERLRALVAQALEHNRDLRMAALALEQARAQYQIRGADRAPTVNLGATGSRQTTSGDSIGSAYTAGLMVASWEIDFFGRLASLQEAALAQYLATAEARRAVQTSLVAAVANAWLGLQSDEEMLALTRSTLQSREASLKLVQMRNAHGVASALDVRQAESLVAAAQAALAQQERQRALDLNALTLLLGQTPAPGLLPAGGTPDAVFAELPVGLPSDLLVHRADIRQAEQNLLAANANIGAARAAFFPRISLTASAGTASKALSGLFAGGSWGWALAPQALLPIFDAGRNQAALESAQAGRAMAVAQYEKAIQTAFREVADALAGRATLGEQVRAQQAQAVAEAERLRLADLRYSTGVASYLDVLDAQRSLFAAQQALAQVRMAQRQNQVLLYKALGGGWALPPEQ